MHGSGRIVKARVTIRIEAEVTLRETDDERGLEATYVIVPEALVEPNLPRAATDELAARVAEKAARMMREDPQVALGATRGQPTPDILRRFGITEAVK